MRPISCELTRHVVPLWNGRNYTDLLTELGEMLHDGTSISCLNIITERCGTYIQTKVKWRNNFKKLEIITLCFCEHTKRTESKWLNWSPHKAVISLSYRSNTDLEQFGTRCL
jgi:hypothetical protein